MKRTEKFKLGELFEIKTTPSTDKGKLTFNETAPYDFIGRTSVNYGIQGKVNELSIKPNPANTFSLVQVGETIALYREREWYASQNIFILTPRNDSINSCFLYFQAVINAAMKIYGKGYNSYPTLQKLNDTVISLPIFTSSDLSPIIDPTHTYSSQGFIPDFAYMEHYVAELEAERVAELEAYLRAADLDDYELTEDDREVLEKEEKGEIRKKEFRLGELFEIKKVYGQPLSSYKQGLTPYVTGSGTNNGVIGFVNVSEDPSALSDGNCIAIDPIKGFCKYQSTAFVGRGFSGASINLLYHKDLNESNALYICAAIEKTSLNKASYSKLLNSNKLNDTVISLPIDSEGNICFAFMEKYIKAIEKLSVAGVVRYKDRVIEETKKLIA